MKRLLYLMITVWLCVNITSFAQNPEWINYNTSNSGLPSNDVYCVTIDEFDSKWIGTGKGLVKFDGTDWVVYNSTNSDLPSNLVATIAIDKSNNKWLSTSQYHNPWGDGLIKFDDTQEEWTIYDTLNSGLAGNYVSSIEIDENNNIWIGTGLIVGYQIPWGGEGLTKFDGAEWTVFNRNNSDLPSNFIAGIAVDESNNKWLSSINYNGDFQGDGLIKFDDTQGEWTIYDTLNPGLDGIFVTCIEIDESDNKWIGTNEGLVKYDNSEWIFYDINNSPLPSSGISCIAPEKQNIIWIGTYEGFFKFDGTNWEVYNSSNSGLPFNEVESITIDKSGNKWIGTSNGGLAVFNEVGIVTDVKNNVELETVPEDYVLYQNYPNPFNPTTTISYSIPVQSPQSSVGSGQYQESSSQHQVSSIQPVPAKWNEAGHQVSVSLKVYDVLGKEVATLVNAHQRPGSYQVKWDVSGQSSGVYFYKLMAGQFTDSKKMILLR